MICAERISRAPRTDWKVNLLAWGLNLLVAMTTVWGLRLAGYLAWRNAYDPGELTAKTEAAVMERDPDKRKAMYEPVHGSAPDIAGKGIANPIATIASFAMALRYSFDLGATADRIETAIASVLDQGYRTADIMQKGCKLLGTAAMGEAIVTALDRAA